MTNVTGKVQGQTRLKVVVGGEWLREDVVVILEPVAPDAPDVSPASPSALELVWSSRSAVRDGYRVRRAATVDGTFEEKEVEAARPGLVSTRRRSPRTWSVACRRGFYAEWPGNSGPYPRTMCRKRSSKWKS